MLWAAPALLYAANFSYTGSLQFSTGEYLFTEPTRSFSFYNGLMMTANRFHLSLNLPLVVQNTPWVSHSGVGYIPSGGERDDLVSRDAGKSKITMADTGDYEQIGWGDPILYAGYELIREQSGWPSLTITGSLKIPLADVDRGFGTGEWDYGVGGSLVKSFNTTMIFCDAGYWVVGDMPALELKDTFVYSVAAGKALADGKTGVLASFSGSSRTIEDADPPLLLGLGFNYSLDTERALTASLMVGLTETAPDFSLGFGWRIGL